MNQLHLNHPLPIDRGEHPKRPSVIAAARNTHEWLVLERDNEVIGYAYAHAFNPRAAYQWSAETSIYISTGLPAWTTGLSRQAPARCRRGLKRRRSGSRRLPG
jgi:hypothetical protein